MNWTSVFIGLLVAMALWPLSMVLLRLLAVEVEDEEALLVLRFGKLWRHLQQPGLHWLPSRSLPWIELRRVSLRRDFRIFRDVHVNDARGTTLVVDLWLELRVADAVRASFSIDDWDNTLKNLVAHAATSILGGRDFETIQRDRNELGQLLQRDIAAECERWGLHIELALIRDITLLPEVSRQMFAAVAARLERAKATVEEGGRLSVAQLEADTSLRTAALSAEAKGQYPQAIGRAYAQMNGKPNVRLAYDEIYALSQLRPPRTIAFCGFGEQLRSVDAAMIPTKEP